MECLLYYFYVISLFDIHLHDKYFDQHLIFRFFFKQKKTKRLEQ